MINAEELDRLTWQDLFTKYSDINREYVNILSLIAQKLGVYEEARGKWQFLEYSAENQIFKALDIKPDKYLVERYEVIRLKNKRIM